MSFWTESELEVVAALYQSHGAVGVRKVLRHRSITAIRKKAEEVGVNKSASDASVEWPVPAQSIEQQWDCLRLRNWRGPVMAGPLVGVIGRVMA